MKAQAIQPTKVSYDLSSRRAEGFTLIELMVTLVILGILLGVGIPGMQNLADNMAVRSNSDLLTNTLSYARGEAVSRVDNVSVRSIGGGTAWNTGWRVFLDANGDCLAAGDTVIREVAIDPAKIVITSGAASCIAFDRFGEKTQPLAGTASFTVSRNSATARTVSVTPTGAVR